MKRVAGHESLPVTDWQICSTAPGAVDSPEALVGTTWLTAPNARTAAGALRAAGRFSLDDPPRRFDAEDWWFKARLPQVTAAKDDELALSFEGLATIADVWLDGAPLLSSDNMFRAHERVVASSARELVIRFRSLDALLGAKRPRPRWRTPVVDHQQLRWFRTTLLGRMPGFSPPAAPVGPWRPVRLERRTGIAVDDVAMHASVTGTTGRLAVTCKTRSLGGTTKQAEIVLRRGDREHRGPIDAALEIPNVDLWWPHTHGEPALYEARLEIDGRRVELGNVGFRTVERDGDFSIRVNGVPLFCRGACWTPLDVVDLDADDASLARAVAQVRDANMNMLRIGGTFVYETDAFYDLLDANGILLWQELMFANMDYPDADAAFVENASAEITHQLERLRARPCLAVVCGNSEGEQQAAMFGSPRERWSPRLFHEIAPAITKTVCPDVPYWPSSAHGGSFPHQVSTGTTSYYGVGVYLRGLDDARRSECRFATECLAFANVPDSIAPNVKVPHPVTWPWRSPEELGGGWDFEDVREHYIERLYRTDPVELRWSDRDRYLALGRTVNGELMAETFGEWRRRRSVCRGGLVWFMRDLQPGAGWGVIDVNGAPKAPWWYLKRALAPIALHMSDEGCSGVAVHVVNDTAVPVSGVLELTLFRAGSERVTSVERAIEVPPRDALEIPALSLFESFYDLSYAFRFAPPSHDLIVARLKDTPYEAFYFPLGLPNTRELDLGLAAEARLEGDDLIVTIRTRRFAQSLTVEVEHFSPDDAYFHLAPGTERTLRFRRTSEGAPRGVVRALNCEYTSKISIL